MQSERLCRAGREVPTGSSLPRDAGCDRLGGRQGKQTTWSFSGTSGRNILCHSLRFWILWLPVLSSRGFRPTTDPPAATFTSDSCSKDLFHRHR